MQLCGRKVSGSLKARPLPPQPAHDFRATTHFGAAEPSGRLRRNKARARESQRRLQRPREHKVRQAQPLPPRAPCGFGKPASSCAAEPRSRLGCLTLPPRAPCGIGKPTSFGAAKLISRWGSVVPSAPSPVWSRRSNKLWRSKIDQPLGMFSPPRPKRLVVSEKQQALAQQNRAAAGDV